MFGTNVPEASVHEHRDLAPGKNDIRANLHSADIDPKVFAIAEPDSVQCLTQGNFWFRISSAIRPHVPRTSRVERCGVETALVSLPSGAFGLALSHITTGGSGYLASGNLLLSKGLDITGRNTERYLCA
jgi:hypothetical protein